VPASTRRRRRRQRHDHGQAAGEAPLLLLARAAEVVAGRTGPGPSSAALRVSAGPRREPSARRRRRAAVAHDSPVTIFPVRSPGGRPVARSVSRACCRMSTAAPGRPRPAVRHPSSSVAQHSLRAHGGQTLVLQPHVDRAIRRPAGRELAVLDRGRALAARQRAGQPDHDLDRLLVAHERASRPGRPCPGARSPAASPGTRSGRSRDPDPGVPGVDPEAYAVSHPAGPPRRLGDRRAAPPGPRRSATRRCRRPGRRRPCPAAAADQGITAASRSFALTPAVAGEVVGRGHDRRPCRP
jgi:hypothetical protein